MEPETINIPNIFFSDEDENLEDAGQTEKHKPSKALRKE